MSAADALEGLELQNGWKVTKRLNRSPGGSGGTFSQSYEAENAGRHGFVKAFDFWEAFEPGKDTLTILQALVSAYEHEKAILEHCRERRLSKVVLAIDHGQVQVPRYGNIEGRVYYLIFEMADNDIRCQMAVSTNFGTLVCMRALRDICLGLWQVHKEMIAHQDTKPSNILCYGEGFKLADFGRSSRRGHPVWYDDRQCPGDKGYAPPELLYGHTHADFGPRRLGCDLYMLGNLAAFLFTGVNVTSLLLTRLNAEHHPAVWQGTYSEVLPYLTAAFTSVLEDIGPRLDPLVRDDVILLLSELCNPDLSLRGHPKGLGRYNQYSLERYVTRLDLLTKRLEINIRIARKQVA
jgi:serine/threonine protein kinase